MATGDSKGKDLIFYDGHCGFCQSWVRFVLKRDQDGSRFRFAPLQGTTFAATVPQEVREKIGDSVVVLTADGKRLERSDASVHIFRRLGGWPAKLAGAANVVPRPVRDFVYDCIAKVRLLIWGKTSDLCPMLPAEWRARFEG